MTYKDALKLRARIAYGQVKTAGILGSKKAQPAGPEHPNGMIDNAIFQMFGAQNALNTANDAATEQSLSEDAKQKRNEEYMGSPELTDSYEQARRLKLLETGNGGNLTPEEISQLQTELMAQKDQMAEWDAQNAEAQAAADAAALKRRNLGYGAGAGALAGLGVGAGVYGLAGLFPSLRKRRLLRALIALGAGAGAGLGVGYGVNAGLNSGKIQGAYADAKSRAGGVINALKGA